MKKGTDVLKKKLPASVMAVVILHNIRSSHNVGSIFRTSDALGINQIFLSGYTPAPKDQFGRVNKEIAKVALGAEKTLAWEAWPGLQSSKSASGKISGKILGLIKRLKTEGYTVVAVEQDAKAVDYKKFPLKGPTAFIFGNEVEGLPKSVISACDTAVFIPMRGQKESLNVSVAFGISLARILNL